ncbi:glycerophosphodiester phosphodiesterase 1-like [Liolophura sinensis]|uniref:glycerophosphodiester phosphodiesterase 1-like n=1 Tax=Liolophura sinensis TaxID=3198878 RepID=UPI003158503B
MVSVRTSTLLINLFIFFAILSTLLGTFLALPFFIAAVGCLFYFRFDQVEKEASDEILVSRKGPHIIAHRGASLDAPENTIEAFKLACKNGATAVELDVEFTRDGVPVILHDSTVDRTTNGTGEISSFTLPELKVLRASAIHSSRFPDVRIPTLEEGVRQCLHMGMKIFLDCKGINASKTADTIANLFQKYPDLYGNAVVCSFNPWIILKVRRRDPLIVTALTHRHHFLSIKSPGSDEPRFAERWKQFLAGPLDMLLEWSHNSWLWYLCGNSAFLAHIDQVSVNYVNGWRALGVSVLVWTVNEPHQKEMCLKSLGCPYLTDTLTDSTTKQHSKRE